MATFLGALAFAVLLILAIGFHEFGHFITARWAGIKIRQFFIGFGPTLWSVRRGRTEVVIGENGEYLEHPETEYGVKALPLGGFVKVLGMSPFEDVPPQDYSRSFRAAPAWKRAIVLVAGSATHLLTAFLVLVLIFTVVGTEDPDKPTLRVEVVFRELESGEPAPAFEAGLRPGDEIIAVDGEPAGRWDAVRSRIRSSSGRELELTVRNREGEVRRVRVAPVAQEQDDGTQIGVIGVSPAFGTTRLSLSTGVRRSVSILGQAVVIFVRDTPKAFSPQNLGIVPGRDPGDQRAVSVVGAGRIAAGFVERGEIAGFLTFFVQVSLFIGLLNMLPLPPLDGGHLLLLGIEKVRRRPVDPKTLVPIMAVVTSLLIMLAVVLLFQDIFSPVADPFQ